ncbi:hypothetical protein [Microbacterium sp. CIAB417]|uniref:hypothetical protein n=1 Tax=Microbacterium sp. CIAB417 TaxID=2860287 RepID=UPI001FAC2C67|nr:hypothetical protein [Microbacterium sp. CIAB417]
MASGDIETFQQSGIWFNRIEGESRTLGTGFENREDAVRVGRSAAAARQVGHAVKEDAGPSDDKELFGQHPRETMTAL